MTAEELASKLEYAGCTSELLDNLVHDTADDIASATNNEGIASQVKFLKENGWSDQDIMKWVDGQL